MTIDVSCVRVGAALRTLIAWPRLPTQLLHVEEVKE